MCILLGLLLGYYLNSVVYGGKKGTFMATDKSATILLDFVRDSVGFVFDRTSKPEKYLGQISLIAPNQVAVAAGSVFQYVDFPSALEVRFPHPGIRMGVKFVHLHPGFNQRDAFNNYLSLSHLPFERPLLLPNDIASLTLDPELGAISPEKLAQLNSNLVVPLSVTGTDVSGTVSPNDVASVLEVVLATGKAGTLTLFDMRNRPIARFAYTPGRIAKAVYEQLIGEMGLFEAVYRGRPGSFLFQTQSDFAFEGIPDTQMDTSAMLAEARRRAQELPQIVAAHGGPETRYVRATGQYDPGKINPSLHWVVERIWQSLDSYITIDKLGERIGADTYTALWGLHELNSLGFVQASQTNPFSLNGQLGAPLVGGAEANVWDQIHGFYLDPLSGRPIVQEGNFFGLSPLKDAQVMLHTVAFPNKCQGAILLKDNKLVGVHNGAWVLQPGQAPPPVKLHQMTSFNLLAEIGGKREMLEPPEPTETPAAYVAEKEPTTSLARSSMRKRMSEDLDAHEPEPDSSKLRGMATPNKITKKQIFIGGIALALIGLLMVIFGSMKPSEAPKQATQEPAKTEEKTEEVVPTAEGAEKAAEIAVKDANFSRFPPPGFTFEDTSKVTGDLPSFALVSQRQNQNVMVVVWNNTGPVKDLNLLLKRVPYVNFVVPESLEKVVVDKGQSYVESDTMHWFVGRYTHADDNKIQEMMLVGAYRHPKDSTKSVVIFARPYVKEGNFDFRTSLWLIDSMTQHAAKASDKKAGDAESEASEDKPAPAADADVSKKEASPEKP